jgi:hypothetical protein
MMSMDTKYRDIIDQLLIDSVTEATEAQPTSARRYPADISSELRDDHDSATSADDCEPASTSAAADSSRIASTKDLSQAEYTSLKDIASPPSSPLAANPQSTLSFSRLNSSSSQREGSVVSGPSYEETITFGTHLW